MTVVTGLDLSLVCTGVSTIRYEPEAPIDPEIMYGPTAPHLDVNTHLVTSSGHRDDPRITKGQRIRKIRDQIMAQIPRTNTLTVLEGISYASNNPGTDERHHLWWLISDAHDHLGIPLAICPPSTLKKFTTDRGDAKKAEVVAAVARMWPTAHLPTDDAADSLGLATIAAHHTGLPLPFPVLERHKLALAKITWPQLRTVGDTPAYVPARTAHQKRLTEDQ